MIASSIGMTYNFNDNTLGAIKKAFSSAEIIKEKNFENSLDIFDYFFIRFQQPVLLGCVSEANRIKPLVTNIISGDAAATVLYQGKLHVDFQIQAGLRWTRGIDDEQISIYAQGFCIKLKCKKTASNIYQPFLEATISFLNETGLIYPEECITIRSKFERVFSILIPQKNLERGKNGFFVSRQTPINEALLQEVQKIIRSKIRPIQPKYKREDELTINPAYVDIAHLNFRPRLHQKMMWLLRSDFILAIGVKNAYWISFGEEELENAIDSGAHSYINWSDHYGHPSLAVAEGQYDGSALYGGYFCQRIGHVAVFTLSGRFDRDDLTEESQRLLEAYVALQLQSIFGNQDIRFYQTLEKHYYELSCFFSNTHFPSFVKERVYNSEFIQDTLSSSIAQRSLMD